MNTGGQAFPVADTYHPNGQVQFGSYGMTLLDWFAGQALAGMAASSFWAENVQANRPDYMKPVALSAYAMAEAMLTEKARREAGHSENKLGKDPSESKIIRAGWDLFTWADKTMEETDECRVFLHNWREAVVKESSTTDHSGEAGKMVELEAQNRELVQALSAMEMWVPTHCENQAVAAARAVLARAKETKL